jgi:hypothetical protein
MLLKEWKSLIYRKSKIIRDRLCGYRSEIYCVSCEVRTEFLYVMLKKVDRLCGLVVRAPGYRKEMYCDSCEVQTEFIYVVCYVEESKPPLWDSGQSSWLQNGDVL